MANFLSILSKIFGNKYDKDIKQITPIVEEINKEYENLANLTHDELRKKTIAFKQQINDFISEEKLQIQPHHRLYRINPLIVQKLMVYVR